MKLITVVFKHIERIANILALFGLILSITVKVRDLLGYESKNKNDRVTESNVDED